MMCTTTKKTRKNKGGETKTKKVDGRWRNKQNEMSDRMKGSDRSSGYRSPSIHGERREMWVAHKRDLRPSLHLCPGLMTIYITSVATWPESLRGSLQRTESWQLERSTINPPQRPAVMLWMSSVCVCVCVCLDVLVHSVALRRSLIFFFKRPQPLCSRDFAAVRC